MKQEIIILQNGRYNWWVIKHPRYGYIMNARTGKWSYITSSNKNANMTSKRNAIRQLKKSIPDAQLKEEREDRMVFEIGR